MQLLDARDIDVDDLRTADTHPMVVHGDVRVEPRGPTVKGKRLEFTHRRELGKSLIGGAQRNPGHLRTRVSNSASAVG